MIGAVAEEFAKYAKVKKNIPEDALTNVSEATDPARLADLVSGHLGVEVGQKQELLETLDVAERLQVSPDPFLMAVAVAASCAFLTPIGHKNNTLIMGPGGYGFGDYWRMGLPLEILVVATAIPMILLVWPL